MTVSTEVSREEYTGNGVTTDFDYRFRVFSADELVVTVADTTENIRTLVLNTDYTVTGAGSRNGGKVKLVSALANNWRISIERELPVTQETDVRNQGNFFPEVHEDAWDKLTMLIQQAFSWLGLALRKPNWLAKYYDAKGNRIANMADPAGSQDAATKGYVDGVASSNLIRALRVPEPIPSLPPAASRRNTIPAFDSAGEPTVMVPVGGSAADVLLQLASDDKYLAPVDHVHVRHDTSVSFRKFLTVKNGSVNATQALIDAMTSGYAVEIPHDYVLRVESANLPTQSGTRIFGQAGSRPSILIDHTDTTAPQIAVTVFNYFANLRFRYPHQKLALATGELPITYGALFDGGGYFSELHNIDVGNAYYAFKLGNETSSSSKITMSNIIGAPLFRGLSLDRVMDVPRISDVHWNYNFMRDYLLPGENYTYDDTLKLWMQNNATAFHIGRCDFATFFRLFSYGYFRGLYTRSERYTGSADNCRFVGCDQDMCLHPIWFQNWENRISVIDTKLVGAINSGYALKEPSSNVIFDNGKDSSVAIIDGVDMGYLSSNALATGTNTVVTNSKIHDFGVTSGSQGNGIIQTADRTVYVDGTIINGSAGTQTRGVFSSASSKQLTLGDGFDVTGATLSSYDWRYGSVAPSRNARLGGSPGHNGISFVSNIPKTYPCEVIPTAGNYFKKGDYAEMTKPVIHSATGVPAYIVKGWNRLTDSNPSGTNHALGTDWVEDRNYFNGVS
ncbi:hypothetical protein ACI2JW_18320 [Serratia ureilytica]|uniref:hypothetical protein n=1 Tax=Serratia ureilytica TaxID=300181 RepID=UPI00384C1247